MSNLPRLEQLVASLPEVSRVGVAPWGGEPTFRVGGRCFVFASPDAASVTVKLSIAEAQAVVATDPAATPAGYGMGGHGWVSITLGARPSAARWREVAEWVRTSCALVAPRRLARPVTEGHDSPR